MKAARIEQFGGRDAVKIVDIDIPSPAEDQVLVEMHASSINPADIKVREGLMVKSPPIRFPMTLGMDVAGVVAETGAGVSGIHKGDNIYGQTHAWSDGSGAFAEYAVMKADSLSMMPAYLGFPEAGAIPLTGVSALTVIHDHIGLKKGQRIFILGGAGGIGSIAIQLAKYIGAYVATTGTGDDIEYERRLGADEIIDYKSQDFEKVLSGYESVFDTVGGELYTRAYRVLKRDGIIVSMGMRPDEELMEKYGVNAAAQYTKVTAENLRRLTKYIEDGVIEVHIDRSFPLDSIHDAFEAKEHGPVRGKIVVIIQ